MALYGMFSFIDYAIYSMVAFIVKLIIIIANTDFFKPEVIEKIADRVYIALGVFVLFKIVITSVQYMVNPDIFDDKEKGMGAILKKTLICMLLLVVIRPVFSIALEVQSVIVQTVPGLVLEDGNNYQFSNNNGANTAKLLDEIGDEVAGTTIWAFATVKDNNCDNMRKDNDFTNVNCSTGTFELKNASTSKVDTFLRSITKGCDGSIWALFSTDKCYFDYRILISTAAGIFLLYVLASMALDIGIRTIKLGILQILAPIPIGSYIVSKEKLNKFIKLSVKVYTDLFVRLAVIYFIIFFVGVVVKSLDGDIVVAGGNYQVGGLEQSFIKVIIVVALFMFAKNAPKFISEALGIDGGGFGDMADMFKPAWQRAGGLAAIGGSAGAGLANMANKINQANGNTFGQKLKNTLKNTKSRHSMLRSGIAGATSAGFHGVIAAAQGKGSKDVYTAGYRRAVTARQNRELDELNNLKGAKGFYQRMRVGMYDRMGLDTDESLAEGQQKAYSKMHGDIGAIKGAVNGRISKIPNVSIRTDIKANSALSQLGKLMDDNWETIMESGNTDLINYCNKFERTVDADGRAAYKLRAGESLSYHDIAAINADATQAGIGSIAGATRDGGPLMQLAQKEIQIDAIKDRVMLTDGTSCDEINIHSGKTHTDITTALNAAQQDARENSVSLGKMEFMDKNGVKHTYEKETLPNAIVDFFSDFDDTIQTRSAETASKMATSIEARARESAKRRTDNKKNSS